MNKHHSRFSKLKKKWKRILNIKNHVSKDFKCENVVTVEDFRDRLRNHFVTFSVEKIKSMKLDDGYFLNGKEFKFDFDINSVSDDQLCLLVQISLDEGLNLRDKELVKDGFGIGYQYVEEENHHMLLVDELTSLDDIYTLTNTGFCRLNEEKYVPDEHDPVIYTHIPFDYVDLSEKFIDHIQSGSLPNTFCGYFFTDEHLNYIDDEVTRMTESNESSTPSQIRLSDPRTRHYLVIEFGLFSGLDYSMKWTKITEDRYKKSVSDFGKDQLFKGRGENIEVTKEDGLISIGFPNSYDIKDEDFLWDELKPRDLHNLSKIKEIVSTYQWDQIQDFVVNGHGGRIIIKNDENDDLDKKLGRQSQMTSSRIN